MRLPLSAVEVRKLWGATTGKDYMMWRVMILTGARIGEALSVDRADLVSEGRRIDESALKPGELYEEQENPDCTDSGITTRRGGGVARNPQSPADVSHERWRDAPAATMGSWKQW